jgi:hypothetical protein
MRESAAMARAIVRIMELEVVRASIANPLDSSARMVAPLARGGERTLAIFSPSVPPAGSGAARCRSGTTQALQARIKAALSAAHHVPTQERLRACDVGDGDARRNGDERDVWVL